MFPSNDWEGRGTEPLKKLLAAIGDTGTNFFDDLAHRPAFGRPGVNQPVSLTLPVVFHFGRGYPGINRSLLAWGASLPAVTMRVRSPSGSRKYARSATSARRDDNERQLS